MVQDTPADCAEFNASQQPFPGCPLLAQSSTCEIDPSLLTYKDYNNDLIYPPPSGSLGRNIMSYWRNNCRTEFTPYQKIRAQFYFLQARQSDYTPNNCGNFIGKIEYEGSSLGLPGVTVRIRHNGKIKEKCNATTDLQGGFSGMLHDFQMRASVYHNGKRSTVALKSDPLRTHYDHTRCEWLRGVNSKDLSLISNHILGLKPLSTGYQKIAADVDKSGTITTFDMVEIKKFLLGTSLLNGYSTLPAFDQPWRFFPEFIPKLNTTQFNANPFSMSINGSQVSCNTYTSKDWLFFFPNSSQGFDAVKIGDVDSSWPSGSDDSPCEAVVGLSSPTLLVNNASLVQDDVVKITFKTGNFQHLQAFQFGLNLPSDKFEILEVTDVSLPNYDENEGFGLALLNEGKIATLWYNPTDSIVSLADNTVLFSLRVRAKQSISDIQPLITLDDTVLPCNVWMDSVAMSPSVSPNLEVSIEPVIDLRNQSQFAYPLNPISTQSFRCFPNPFSQGFLLAFDAVQADASAKLIVSDLAGRTVAERNEQVVLGRNVFSVGNLSAWPDGTYTAALTASGQVHTVKILKKSR